MTGRNTKGYAATRPGGKTGRALMQVMPTIRQNATRLTQPSGTIKAPQNDTPGRSGHASGPA